MKETAIITEATLSFLGVGVPPTSPSLGTLIRVGNDYLFSGEWWITIFPGLMLVLIIAVATFNILSAGEGVTRVGFLAPPGDGSVPIVIAGASGLLTDGQRDAVRALVADVTERGPGQRYLIEHSAGSGKSNTIAWLAWHLADVPYEGGHLFEKVVVVTNEVESVIPASVEWLESMPQSDFSKIERAALDIKTSKEDDSKK